MSFEKNLYEPKAVSGVFDRKDLTFYVDEDRSSKVCVQIETAEGKVIDFSDFLPVGWRFIGNLEVMKDSRFLGMGDIETSVCDSYYKVVILSWQRLEKEKWRYLFEVLHEIGHAYFNEANPDYYKPINEKRAGSVFKFKESFFLLENQTIATDEIQAWQYAFKKFEQICQELGINPTDYISEEEKKQIVDESFGLKVKSSIQGLSRFNLSKQKILNLTQKLKKIYKYNNDLNI